MFKMIAKLFKKLFRVAYNEIDSVLSKMESLERSLKNALEEHQDRYKAYKTNCGKIFALEVELGNDVNAEKTALASIESTLVKQKALYAKSPNDDTKSAIMYFLDKQQHHESKLESLTANLQQQIEQNKKVTVNLRDYERKISELKQKVDYVQTQIKIAKNKEMMMELSSGTGNVYDISEVFTNVQKYIAEIDGKERVESIVGETNAIVQQCEESVREDETNRRFVEFMGEETK
jgi:phage shock protein A